MLHIIDHPLIADELAQLREPRCPSPEFRQRMRRIASLKHPSQLSESEILILDPMLATGGSAIEAVKKMKEAGAKRLRFVCLVAAPEGVKALEKAFPKLEIFTACLDRCLNARGYILPGLGDAGDRLFGTCA